LGLQETELLFANDSPCHSWIEHFKQYRNVDELSRELAVNLIKRIGIYEGKRISVRFRYQDRLEAARGILNGYTVKEAGCM